MEPQYQPGRYWGKVTAQSLGSSKNKGTPQFTLTCLIMGMVDLADPDGDLIACQQAERTVYRYITANTMEWFAQDLERLGFNGTSFGELDPQRPGFHDFKGVELALMCEHEKYEGKLKEKWQFADDGGGPVSKPLEDREIRQLNDMFGKELKKKTPNGKPASRRVNPNTALEAANKELDSTTTPDHDIPF